MNKKLRIKLKESFISIFPVTILITILIGFFFKVDIGNLIVFEIGALMLIFGMGLFALGADVSMMRIGEEIGAYITKKQKIWLIVFVGFIIGFLVTVAEPDLWILAEQIPELFTTILIFVGIGVGIFLVLSLLRIIFQIRLAWLLLICYSIIFILATFVPQDFFPFAFDSGGVTTGPIVVPFIMALGIGVAISRGDVSSKDDSFGLVGIVAMGPIFALMILGIIYRPQVDIQEYVVPSVGSINDFINIFLDQFKKYSFEILIAFLPIILVFIVMQIFAFKLSKKNVIKIFIGLFITYLGLVFFLAGANIGFLPIGTFLGSAIVNSTYNWLLIPIGMAFGFTIVMAEPSVHLLKKQVEEISDGAINKNTMLYTLASGVSVSIGLSMIRVLTGVSIWWFLLPGFAIALSISFFVPKIFTAIAFDSGGAASGPMQAAFLLPFAIGAARAVGSNNVLADAFGLVSLASMTPLITIQVLGLISRIKSKKIVVDDEAEEIIYFEKKSDNYD